MRLRNWILILFFLSMGLGLVPAGAQETDEAASEEKETKELKFAGTPYVYTGPDTGAGAGFAIMYRDMFGKEGRDTSLSLSYTENLYQDYSIDWQEPYFLSQNGRLKLGLSYSTRPALRFFGFGNEASRYDVCNWASTTYDITPAYVYRWPKTSVGVFGLRGQLNMMYSDPDNGRLDNKDAGNFNRKIRDIFPDLYRSEDFEPSYLIAPQITVYRDTRSDRFPLGGGREEVVWPMKGGYEEFSYSRYDKAIGSDFSYNGFSLDVRRFFPIIWDDTILALRGKVSVTQGNVPFYQLPSFTGRGYYGMRFIDKNATEFNVELRQGFLPNAVLPLFNGLITLKYPSICVYWEEGRVYDDYTEIGDNLFEDYHWVYGWGFRFVVTPSIVIRFDWGFSAEQTTFYMTAGLPF